MGSILNFILLFDQEYPDWCFQGPLTNHIHTNYNYKNEVVLEENKKNIIVIEPTETLKGIINNFDYKINNIPLYQFVKQNNITLLLGSIADPPSLETYQSFREKIKDLDIEANVKLISSNLQICDDICDSYHHFIEESTKEKHLFFQYELNELGYFSEEIKEDELNIFKNKKFLSFNKNVDKQHRFSLLHDFIENDFSDSLFSFLYLEGIHCYPYQSNIFDLEKYQNYIPLEIDTQNKKDLSFKTNNTFDKSIFLDTCINIVTETSYHDNELFISEKILKPILNYQPFIVLGPVNYLKELKKFGFKTFDSIWDESYDLIESPIERYFKVQSLILELNNKTIYELNNLYQKCKEICIHNKKTFENLECNSVQKFLDKL
jgi:hypothetical protein